MIRRRQPSKLNVCGREVVRLRSARGWSQVQFVAKCQLAGWDVSRDIIAGIELQRRRVDDRELAWLAQTLKAPLEEFYPRELRAKLPKR